MTSNGTGKIPDEDSLKEQSLQEKLSEQKRLLSILRTALIDSSKKKKNSNSCDIDFLLKRF